MKISKDMPEGHFVAIWKHRGLWWSGTFQNNKTFLRYNSENNAWKREDEHILRGVDGPVIYIQE